MIILQSAMCTAQVRYASDSTLNAFLSSYYRDSAHFEKGKSCITQHTVKHGFVAIKLKKRPGLYKFVFWTETAPKAFIITDPGLYGTGYEFYNQADYPILLVRNKLHKKYYYREQSYRIWLVAGTASREIFSEKTFEYYSPSYIEKHIAIDSVFSEKHKIKLTDLNGDGRMDVSDKVEIKYRKKSCCEHHFEYGLRNRQYKFLFEEGVFR
jgi:hypothetical protein